MSVTTPGWQQHLQTLLAAPADSFDHRFGERLAAADDDQAWSLLTTVIVEDPCSTHEYKVAARMLGHLAETEVAL
ncbi:hypothetical protein [Nocardia spumae]|uniref:hypothetical protein n=1 Tax=Nocardia spumae TaxID=2887190 RepID=UPI001D13E324|nr:hypothetical protein [Nocardia spumae]